MMLIEEACQKKEGWQQLKAKNLGPTSPKIMHSGPNFSNKANISKDNSPKKYFFNNLSHTKMHFFQIKRK
jgi:hypothetical protein